MATGQGSPLTPDLARALTPVAKSIVEPLRQYGVYAAEVEPGPDADDAAALLGYLGRSPAWAGLKPHAHDCGYLRPLSGVQISAI